VPAGHAVLVMKKDTGDVSCFSVYSACLMIEVNIVVCIVAEADTDDGLLVKTVGLPEENICD